MPSYGYFHICTTSIQQTQCTKHPLHKITHHSIFLAYKKDHEQTLPLQNIGGNASHEKNQPHALRTTAKHGQYVMQWYSKNNAFCTLTLYINNSLQNVLFCCGNCIQLQHISRWWMVHKQQQLFPNTKNVDSRVLIRVHNKNYFDFFWLKRV